LSLTSKGVTLRPIVSNDLPLLWDLVYKEEWPEWKNWDAPYYEHVHVSRADFIKNKTWVEQDDRWAIEVSGQVIGTIGYYWEHKPSRWLEMGIIIYDSNYWNGGYGTIALQMWISHLFLTMPLVRVGYTTWSGNQRMIKVGEKLGMKMEARLRKCRFYQGTYYDSIRMGMLREEWETSSWSI
jgi:RimJ/RimL family protein N-acetyltransferase